MRLIRRACVATLVTFGLPVFAEESEFLPLQLWLAPAQITSMKLSPDGKRVAGIGAVTRPAVFVKDLADSRTTVVAQWQLDHRRLVSRSPIAVNWISDDLLAIDYSNKESESVDLSGKKVAELGERFMRRMVEKGLSTDLVLAYRDIDEQEIDVVNARTGSRQRYKISLPGKPVQWAFDQSGALRAVTTMETSFWAEKTKIKNWYRTDERADWQLLEETPVTDDFWLPLRVLPEPNSLAIRSRHGRDTYAVFRYDTVSRQHVEVMAGHPHEDILSVNGLDGTAFESVVTNGIKPGRHWFDPQWARLQASVDAALPGRINVIAGNKNDRLLITSYGDVDPGHWYVLDIRTSKFWEVGKRHPYVDPKRMRPMETVEYQARDGTLVNAYLTRPARRSGPAPMVVLIHGGPHLRDYWGWNKEVQLLASYGYVVFQPQFRGSTGFGRKFEQAGYRQWGRAMQDDITDGVQHLISQKIADPARICIYGASYGGYAALWGLIKTPELYQCGISFAGVSDLVTMLSGSLFDDSTPLSRELWRARIGDVRRPEELDEVSPLKNVAKVDRPVLIAHGKQDTRVLPSQSESMVAALERLHKPVEWMPFEGEGHGLYGPDNQRSYYAALLSFLQRHIGDRHVPSAEVATPSTGPADSSEPSSTSR